MRSLLAANPGLPDGGPVGESKADILRRLPPECTIPFLLVPAATPFDAVQRAVAGRGWRDPLVAKPDVGQRGAGVKRVESSQQLEAYFGGYRGAVLLQPWHPGPHEAGIFYARRPHEPRGRIFSITDKHFPYVTGDGVATFGALIQQHPRFRRQATVFLRRNAAHQQRVLATGERYSLGHIGNHAQGAIFLDGSHLVTPALTARIDDISQSIPGFFVGRFDVRYGDARKFKAGEDLAIVELNGVAAESTNIYDPSRTLLAAYRTLYAQWKLVFEIGAANRAVGRGTIGRQRLASLVWRHLTDARDFPV